MPGADDSLTLADVLEDPAPPVDDQTEDYSLSLQRRAAFYALFDELPFRDRDIVYHRLLADPVWTLDQCAQKHGVSRERIRQIEVKAVEKIRKAIGRDFRHLCAA